MTYKVDHLKDARKDFHLATFFFSNHDLKRKGEEGSEV